MPDSPPQDTDAFDPARYLCDAESQIAALIDAYESGHPDVINSILAACLRARTSSGPS